MPSDAASLPSGSNALSTSSLSTRSRSVLTSPEGPGSRIPAPHRVEQGVERSALCKAGPDRPADEDLAIPVT